MTDLLCITCAVYRPRGPARRPNTPNVCDGCRERLATDLAAFPTAYAAVDVEPGRMGGERRGSGFESRPPLNTSALSLLSHGSVVPAIDGSRWPQDQLGAVPPLDLLLWWCEDWHATRNRREQMPNPNAKDVADWLGTRLDWACGEHLAVDEFAADLRDITGILRAFAAADKGERVGNCPRTMGEQRCNTPLYVDPYVDEIECPRCKQKWKRRAGEWMHLRAQQLAAGVEATE